MWDTELSRPGTWAAATSSLPAHTELKDAERERGAARGRRPKKDNQVSAIMDKHKAAGY